MRDKTVVSRRLSALGMTLAISVILIIFGSTKTYAVSYPPVWGNAICNNANHPGSYQLSSGSIYNGVMACGPLGGLVQVNYAPGLYGEYEWQCVELVMRYMYLVYGVNPYSSPGGKDVVNNYTGTRLLKKSNNGSSLPTPGDILAMGASGSYSTGHTAVITGVNITNGNGTVYVIQQNGTPDGLGSVAVYNNILQSNVTGWLHDPNGGGRLTQMNNDGSGWNTWDVSSGYKSKGTPLVMWGSGILDIYALNANGGLDQYHQNTATGVWTVYNVLTGTSFARGVTGVLSGTTLNLFVSDTSGYLHHIQKPSSGAWADYTLSNGGNASNNIYGDPAVLWTSGSVSVFGVNQSGNLLQYYVPQGQTNWVVYNVLQPASPWTGGVAVFQLGSGTYLHGTNANHRFMEAGATNGNWIMSDISQAAGSSTDVADTPGTMLGINTIDVFPRGNDGSLQQFHLNLITGVWTQYLNVRPSSTSLSNGTSVSMWSNTTEVFSVAN